MTGHTNSQTLVESSNVQGVQIILCFNLSLAPWGIQAGSQAGRQTYKQGGRSESGSQAITWQPKKNRGGFHNLPGQPGIILGFSLN